MAISQPPCHILEAISSFCGLKDIFVDWKIFFYYIPKMRGIKYQNCKFRDHFLQSGLQRIYVMHPLHLMDFLVRRWVSGK
jgi:hypothetical protein